MAAIVIFLLMVWTNISPHQNKFDVLALENIQRQSDTCGQLITVENDLRTIAPWTVAIYRRRKGRPPQFIVTGTILSPNLISSVAGGPAGLTLEQAPFSNSSKRHKKFPFSSSQLFIAAGVNSTDFSKHDQHAQYASVAFAEPFRDFDSANVYFHTVLYHLKTPLTLAPGSPYVREICLHLFYLRKTATVTYNAIFGHDVLLAGFVRRGSRQVPSAPAESDGNRPGLEEQEAVANEEWTLAAFKGKTGPRRVCESHFRYHYKRTPDVRPLCYTINHDRTGVDALFTNVLDSIWTDGRIPDDDQQEFFCPSHGVTIMYSIGKWWYMAVAPFSLLPSQKRDRRCARRNAAYFTEIYNIPLWKKSLEWIYHAYKCPPTHFACGGEGSSLPCVPWSKLCDRVPDCVENQADEHYTLCGRYQNLYHTLPRQPPTKGSNVSTSMGLNGGKTCPKLTFLTKAMICKVKEVGAQFKNVDCDLVSGRVWSRVRVECGDRHAAPAYSYQSLDFFCGEDGGWEDLRPFHCEEVCGILHEATNGTVDNLGNMPWRALVYKDGVAVCGATFIEKSFLITHAACLADFGHKGGTGTAVKMSSFRVQLFPLHGDQVGVTEEEDKFGKMIEIKNVWMSSDKDASNKDDKMPLEQKMNDIALIQLQPISGGSEPTPTPACYLIQFKPEVSYIGQIGQISSDCQDQDHDNGPGQFPCNVQVVQNEECIRPMTFGNFSNLQEIQEESLICTKMLDPETKLGVPKFLGGSGLFFPHQSLHGGSKRPRFILKGILMEGGAVGTSTLLFVNVDHHAEWILDILETYS